MADYGTAQMTRHADGSVVVDHADDVIGVSPELLDEAAPHHYDGRTLTLDTAGEHRYDRLGEHPDGVVLFQRTRSHAA